jgi:aldehyde dehydrogenase (NAD+)
MDALRRLRDALKLHEEELLAALHDDVRKPPFEAFITEVGPVMDDLKHAVKNLVKWMDPERVKTPLSLFPARSRVYHDPYGVVLIIAPWNYPLSLVIAPLIGALAAGNCAVLKTSPLAVATTAVLKKILGDLFPGSMSPLSRRERHQHDAIKRKIRLYLLHGGASVGREVYRAAAGALRR